ncbi:MAG: NAD(P)/FAD-dependent oxidoreductase, partial [bacterium]
ESKLMGHGVSACATCDGWFFRGKEVAVIGGGDSACEEATFLTKFATKVTMIHRRDQLRASKIMQHRVMSNPKISFLWNSVVEDFIGEPETGLEGLKIKNILNGSSFLFPVQGAFLAIGHTPNSQLFAPWVKTDPKGYILTEPGSSRTNIPGVFACGDVQDPIYRQAVTAAGSGCMAALDCERYLSH